MATITEKCNNKEKERGEEIMEEIMKKVEGRELMGEYTIDELYMRMVGIAESVYYTQYDIKSICTYEDMASDLFLTLMKRDKIGKVGFNTMIEENRTILHFDNVMYKSFKNYCNEKYRRKGLMANAKATSYEDGKSMVDSSAIKLVEDKLNMASILESVKEVEYPKEYSIHIYGKKLELTNRNLIELYQELHSENGGKVSLIMLEKHILCEGKASISVRSIVSRFKKYLVGSGIVQRRGNRYDFA